MSHAYFEFVKKNKIQKMDPMTQMPWAINYRLLKSKLILVAHGYKPMSKPKKIVTGCPWLQAYEYTRKNAWPVPTRLQAC